MDSKPIIHSALWCWHSRREIHEPGYTLFRRRFDCPVECRFQLAVSADNRYNCYLDGILIGRGPCRSDPQHYVYEEYERQLSAGPLCKVSTPDCRQTLFFSLFLF